MKAVSGVSGCVEVPPADIVGGDGCSRIFQQTFSKENNKNVDTASKKTYGNVGAIVLDVGNTDSGAGSTFLRLGGQLRGPSIDATQVEKECWIVLGGGLPNSDRELEELGSMKTSSTVNNPI